MIDPVIKTYPKLFDFGNLYSVDIHLSSTDGFLLKLTITFDQKTMITIRQPILNIEFFYT